MSMFDLICSSDKKRQGFPGCAQKSTDLEKLEGGEILHQNLQHNSAHTGATKQVGFPT